MEIAMSKRFTLLVWVPVLMLLSACDSKQGEWESYFRKIYAVISDHKLTFEALNEKVVAVTRNPKKDPDVAIEGEKKFIALYASYIEAVTAYKDSLNKIASPGDDQGFRVSLLNLLDVELAYARKQMETMTRLVTSAEALKNLPVKKVKSKEAEQLEKDHQQASWELARMKEQGRLEAGFQPAMEQCFAAQDKFFNVTRIGMMKLDMNYLF